MSMYEHQQQQWNCLSTHKVRVSCNSFWQPGGKYTTCVSLSGWLEPTCYVILGNPIEDPSFCILWISFVEKAWSFIYDADQMELYSTRVLRVCQKLQEGADARVLLQAWNMGSHGSSSLIPCYIPWLRDAHLSHDHASTPSGTSIPQKILAFDMSRMLAVTDMHLQVGNQVPSLWIFLVVSFLTCRWISKLTYMIWNVLAHVHLILGCCDVMNESSIIFPLTRFARTSCTHLRIIFKETVYLRQVYRRENLLLPLVRACPLAGRLRSLSTAS